MIVSFFIIPIMGLSYKLKYRQKFIFGLFENMMYSFLAPLL